LKLICDSMARSRSASVMYLGAIVLMATTVTAKAPIDKLEDLVVDVGHLLDMLAVPSCLLARSEEFLEPSYDTCRLFELKTDNSGALKPVDTSAAPAVDVPLAELRRVALRADVSVPPLSMTATNAAELCRFLMGLQAALITFSKGEASGFPACALLERASSGRKDLPLIPIMRALVSGLGRFLGAVSDRRSGLCSALGGEDIPLSYRIPPFIGSLEVHSLQDACAVAWALDGVEAELLAVQEQDRASRVSSGWFGGMFSFTELSSGAGFDVFHGDVSPAVTTALSTGDMYRAMLSFPPLLLRSLGHVGGADASKAEAGGGTGADQTPPASSDPPCRLRSGSFDRALLRSLQLEVEVSLQVAVPVRLPRFHLTAKDASEACDLLGALIAGVGALAETARFEASGVELVAANATTPAAALPSSAPPAPAPPTAVPTAGAEATDPTPPPPPLPTPPTPTHTPPPASTETAAEAAAEAAAKEERRPDTSLKGAMEELFRQATQEPEGSLERAIDIQTGIMLQTSERERGRADASVQGAKAGPQLVADMLRGPAAVLAEVVKSAFESIEPCRLEGLGQQSEFDGDEGATGRESGAKHDVEAPMGGERVRGVGIGFALPPPPLAPLVTVRARDDLALCALMRALKTMGAGGVDDSLREKLKAEVAERAASSRSFWQIW